MSSSFLFMNYPQTGFFLSNLFIIQNCSANALCECLFVSFFLFLSLEDYAYIWRVLQWDLRNLNVLFYCAFEGGKNNPFSMGYLLYLLKMWRVQQLFFLFIGFQARRDYQIIYSNLFYDADMVGIHLISPILSPIICA